MITLFNSPSADFNSSVLCSTETTSPTYSSGACLPDRGSRYHGATSDISGKSIRGRVPGLSHKVANGLPCSRPKVCQDCSFCMHQHKCRPTTIVVVLLSSCLRRPISRQGIHEVVRQRVSHTASEHHRAQLSLSSQQSHPGLT